MSLPEESPSVVYTSALNRMDINNGGKNNLCSGLASTTCNYGDRGNYD